MVLLLVSLILAGLSAQSVCYSSSLSASSVEVFYVKPTSPASAECPPGENVPCHILQYYVDHSNFTSYSEFHFLEGEHYLNSTVEVTNITNLSLIGAGPGVKILCPSIISRFDIDSFFMLRFENISLSNCGALFTLSDGSEASFVNVTRSNNSQFDEVLFFFSNVSASIIDCTFENNLAHTLFAKASSLVAFQGTNTFRNNTAERGAAMRLTERSYLHLHPNVTIYFQNNHASFVGGAIEVLGNEPFCVVDYNLPTEGIELIFTNNTAGKAGFNVFGGVGECCDANPYHIPCDGDLFDDIFSSALNTETEPSALASSAYKVCLCEANRRRPNCSYVPDVINSIPGGVFTLRLAIVDENYEGAMLGIFRADFANSSTTNATLGTLQSTQASMNAYCSDFAYSVFSTNRYETLSLYIYAFDYVYPSLEVKVRLDDCPLGFTLSYDISKCVCAPALDRDNIKCFTEDEKISRQGNTWIGFVNMTDILVNDNCRTGYCLADPVNVTGTNGDDQCESHRTGILCGQCEEGYSLTLGTQECRKCSNTYLLLIIPLGVLGILLVVLLFMFNLTVSEGNINGLIFYANVININYVLHSPNQQNYIYIFLAWLNLDLGISTCLFDGMDAYSETWLQFVFPCYLWIVILLIIFFYKKFPIVSSRLGRKNAVNVLATLLLLSYTKLQQTVVTILSFTSLKYSSTGTVRYVWLYDANVEYFKGKHLYLAITAIAVLIFLIIPYTLCLTFFQHLQAHSRRKLFHWVNELKPVFDAYAGPYKDKYRFWTGMLLIIRMLLIVIFTINSFGSMDLNLLVILVVSLSLLLASTSGIYRKWPYNYLESFFYLQLGVFAGGVAYAKDHGSVTAVVDASVGISLFVTITTVIGYHIVYRKDVIKKYIYGLKNYGNLEEGDHFLEEDDHFLEDNRSQPQTVN